MPSLSLLNRFKYVLLALFIAGPHFVSAAPLVIPQAQAEHFCRLLISDGGSVSPLSVHARKAIQADDSLSIEQIFTGFVLLADGWQTMRIFPHQQDGKVVWYSATDDLPASMNVEHQKYIREVFPRLIAEVQAGHWQAVDEYVDKMLQYQCLFGGNVASAPVSSSFLVVVIIIFVVLILVSRFFYLSLHPKERNNNESENY
jgi:hypothetical protein